MGQTASELRRELDHKRDELTRDVDKIQEKVKSTFDLKGQVEQNPLPSVGLALAGGFLLGMMTGGKKEPDHGRGGYSYASGSHPSSSYGGYQPNIYSYSPSTQSTYNPSSYGQQGAQSGGGMMHTVAEGFKDSFRKGTGGSTIDDTVSAVTAALTAILVDKAKEMFDKNLPGFAARYEQVVQHGQVAPPGQTSPYTTGQTAPTGAGQSSSGYASSERPTYSETGSGHSAAAGATRPDEVSSAGNAESGGSSFSGGQAGARQH
jgi:hypothetical protein